MSAATRPAPPSPSPGLRRIGAIAESATLAVDAKAKALKAAGPSGHRLRRRRARLPDARTTSSRRRSRPAANPQFHRYTPAGGLPELKEAIAAKTLRDSGYEVDAAQVLVTNGGKQALYNAFAAILDPGDEVLLPGPVLDHLPRVDPAGRRRPGRRRRPTSRPATSRPSSSSRPRAPTRTKVAAVRLAVQPDRRGLHRRAGRGDRPLGRSSTACGSSPTRSTSTSSTATRRSPRMPALVPELRRQVHRGQRRRQDLRDDRLAGGLAHRPEGRRQGRDQPAVARHLQRLQRRRRSPRWPPSPATCRPSPRCARPSTAAARRSCRMLNEIDGVDLPRAPGRVLRLPVGQGRCSARRSAAGARRPPPSSPS